MIGSFIAVQIDPSKSVFFEKDIKKDIQFDLQKLIISMRIVHGIIVILQILESYLCHLEYDLLAKMLDCG